VQFKKCYTAIWIASHKSEIQETKLLLG